MHHDKPLKQAHLKVGTDLNAVTEVLQWFEETTLPLLPQSFGSESQLALVEGFTNAVRHAHHDLPPTTPIELEVKVFPDRLEMRIWDKGQPFDMHTKLEFLRQEELELDPLDKEGGRGLLFIDRLTDELAYERLSDDRNCLMMSKRL